MRTTIQIIVLALTILFVGGCQAGTLPEEASNPVTITISENNQEEIIDEVSIELQDNKNLLAILKKNFDIEESGGLITSIEGEQQDPKKNVYWMYEVNGEPANVGAGDYILNSGDKINFDLHEVSY